MNGVEGKAITWKFYLNTQKFIQKHLSKIVNLFYGYHTYQMVEANQSLIK